MLSLSQKLSQQQKLSPQQIQYQKLLQLNTLALEQRIKNELEINPILEEVMEEEYELTQDQLEKEKKDETGEEEFETEYNEDDEFQVEDFMNDYESDYESERSNHSNDEEVYQPLAQSRETLTEHLRQQLQMLSLDDDMYMLGEEIIGNLNDDGYLKRSIDDIVNELNMFEHVNICPDKAENLLKEIQRFDPIGIAARNLQECLLIQLRNIPHDPYYTYLAEELLLSFYDDFTKRRFEAIKQKMNLTDESLKATVDLIQSLNPKPGEGNIESAEMNQITPDFLVEKVDDNFVITLNDKSLPS